MIDSEPRQRLGHYVETLVMGEIVRALAASISTWGVHAGLLQVQIKSDWPAADSPGYVSSVENRKSRI